MQRSEYEGWFSKNIYPLAMAYAAKNPIEGIELEDYIQELVAKAWEKVDTFDPKRATLTTFSYTWFRNVRWRLLDKMINRAKFISWADSEDSDGNVSNVCDFAVSDDDIASEYSAMDAMAMLNPMSVSFFNGDAVRRIAKAFGTTEEGVMAAVAEDLEILRRALGVTPDA